jgi:hypothetical protein
MRESSEIRRRQNHLKMVSKQGLPKAFNLDKMDLIDFAFGQPGRKVGSFADLGGVWGVDGAYTFYALGAHDVKAAFLVDTDFTDEVSSRSRRYGNLKLVKGNFGEKTVLEQVGRVDALFFFDVLLHQVKPDWNEVLEMYSAVADVFVIYNQQWTGSENTVRLLDLGRDEYFRNVPHDPEHPTYKAVFEKMHEMHPQHKRPWRDIHNVWQWGITDGDLVSKIEGLGFRMHYYKNCGRFGDLPNFENHALVFNK